MSKLSLGFSPCPNDTFIFDALVHSKIDTEGLEFKVCIADVEELNQKAMRGELDITKLSYHAFLHTIERYIMLDSGSALGNNCGPLLIKNQGDPNPSEHDLIAIPGKFTTANFLLNFAYPRLKNKTEFLFSEIEKGIKANQVKAGVIIHENRFTYAQRGFEKVKDLGEYWEGNTGMPIPLGGIGIKRTIDLDIQLKIQKLIRKSIEYAFNNPNSCKEFVRFNAQEMSTEVMQKHIKLYVNDFSLSLGKEGKNAVKQMYDFSIENGLIEASNLKLFL
jgi:1,4-dihydroxy-6-naphthoate synthase